MDTMQDLLQKASVLNEALPYIRKFSGKTIVVKYGGSAMVEHELKKKVIRDVALLKLVGFRPIIVHGGGKEITKWTGKVGIETKFINGLRVTDKDTMEVAEMVLNKINKGLVSMMEKVGVKAVGISGKDGSVLRVKKKLSKGEDIGFVGEVTKVNTELLNTLLDNDFVPVICPIGSDDEYHSYNINADDAACAIATAVGASKLVFLTDIEGVSAGQIHTDLRTEYSGSRRTARQRKYRRRHAPEDPELCRCDQVRCFQSTYPGRKDPALPAVGVLYQQRYRYCDYRG